MSQEEIFWWKKDEKGEIQNLINNFELEEIENLIFEIEENWDGNF